MSRRCDLERGADVPRDCPETVRARNWKTRRGKKSHWQETSKASHDKLTFPSATSTRGMRSLRPTFVAVPEGAAATLLFLRCLLELPSS